VQIDNLPGQYGARGELTNNLAKLKIERADIKPWENDPGQDNDTGHVVNDKFLVFDLLLICYFSIVIICKSSQYSIPAIWQK
jgi:hypothetical protein